MNPSPLTDAAALLPAIVQSADDAIVTKDLGGTITSWNHAAERMFGYTAEEAVGRSIRLIIAPDRYSEEDAVLDRIRRGDSVDHYETVRVRRDGALIAVSLTVSPVRSVTGEIIGASKIARDITDRRRADMALTEAQATGADLQRRLLALVAASGSLLGSPHLSDVLPAILRLARELVAADGYAVWRLDLVSKAWSIRSYSGISEDFASAVIKSYGGEPVSTWTFTEPLSSEDVETAPLLDERREAYRQEGIRSMLAIPLTVHGQTSGTLVFYYRARHCFSDVEVQTARALGNLAAAAMTTAELYEEQQRRHTQALFLAESGAALGSSLDYHASLKTVANLAVPHIADWCAVDLVGEGGSVERLAVAPAGSATTDPNLPYSVAQVIRTGASVLLEQVMCVPLLANGRTLGAISFVAAGSERTFSAADLRFVQDVASRMAMAVDNARAYAEARHANRLKDDFLATLSHELRTPLNAILGYVQMVRTGKLTGEKQARALEVAERSAVSLAQIVEEILDVSRIIRGKISLNIQPIQIPVVVNDAVATVIPAADAKNIQVRTTIDSSVGLRWADAERLQQVVWNLVSNAVKFTPRGGRVEVRVDVVEEHVQVLVSDTGVGFPAEFAPHLFERFRQAQGGLAREHGGLGLGLAIARHFVELHGGTIEATSQGKGTGATFRVMLPLAMAQSVSALAAQSPHARGGGFDADISGALDAVRVLAVDDDSDALMLVREILEAAGAQVTTVDSAADALDQIGRAPPDALVADLGMPGMDGFELIQRIRESSDPAVRNIPAAALTAYARSQDRSRALRLGFHMHLAKPIDPAELVAAVASLARRSRSTAS